MTGGKGRADVIEENSIARSRTNGASARAREGRCFSQQWKTVKRTRDARERVDDDLIATHYRVTLSDIDLRSRIMEVSRLSVSHSLALFFSSLAEDIR